MDLNLTHSWIGYLVLLLFIIGYYFIAREEKYSLNKAKPALFIGTYSFLMIGVYFVINGLDLQILNEEIEELIIEISEIFFFLLVAMTFIEVLVDRGVFKVLRKKLVSKGYSYKQLFWIVGLITFFLSPVADNLTTALILSTVLIAISENKKFLVPSAINIVVAANAGGAWSPFGDITTLMAWTAGKGGFVDFLTLFPAAFLGWFITAFLLSFLIPNGELKADEHEAHLKTAGKSIIYLGIFTIFISVMIHQFLHLPAMWGMMFGLSLLQLYAYRLKRIHGEEESFNIFHSIKKTEMDTLIFFFGILAAVGALDFLGYLDYIVKYYEVVGTNIGNLSIGMLSAIIDNIPVMSAVLKSDIDMGIDGWLMLTLTVGTGGSLISFGSAAGVGVMSRMKGIYTFGEHMKLFPIVLIGYLVSIGILKLQYYLLSL